MATLKDTTVTGSLTMTGNTHITRTGGLDWHTMGSGGYGTYANGWGAYLAPYGPPKIAMWGSRVFIQGLVTGGTINTTIFTGLPSGYYPVADPDSYLFCGYGSTSGYRLDITPSGTIAINYAASTVWISLTCSYYVTDT